MEAYRQTENNVQGADNRSDNLYGLIKNDLVLVDSIPRYTNIRVPTQLSDTISLSERRRLSRIFGEFVPINYDDLYDLTTGTKIMIKYHINNSWWVGFINQASSDIYNFEMTIDNGVVLNRETGMIYNTYPSTREVTFDSYDSLFIIND